MGDFAKNTQTALNKRIKKAAKAVFFSRADQSVDDEAP